MNDDDIPTLREVVRPGSEGGRTRANSNGGEPTLSEQEIEAIARRVMDRYSEALEKSLTRAIRRALDRKKSGSKDQNHG